MESGALVAGIIIILLSKFGGTVIDCLDGQFKPKYKFLGCMIFPKEAVDKLLFDT